MPESPSAKTIGVDRATRSTNDTTTEVTTGYAEPFTSSPHGPRPLKTSPRVMQP